MTDKRISQIANQETGATKDLAFPIATNQEVVRAIAEAKDSRRDGKNLVFDPVTGKFVVRGVGQSPSPDYVTITSIVKDGFAKDETNANSASGSQAASNEEVVRAIAEAKDSRRDGKNLVFDPVTGKFVVRGVGQSPSPDYVTITSIVKDGFAKDETNANSASGSQAASNEEVVRAIAEAKDSRRDGKNLVFDPVTGKFVVRGVGQSPSPDYVTITSIVKDGFATA